MWFRDLSSTSTSSSCTQVQQDRAPEGGDDALVCADGPLCCIERQSHGAHSTRKLGTLCNGQAELCNSDMDTHTTHTHHIFLYGLNSNHGTVVALLEVLADACWRLHEEDK